jgi:hypothetical protein
LLWEITIIIVKIPEVRVLEISKEQISLERSVSNTGRGKQREGEIKNGFYSWRNFIF